MEELYDYEKNHLDELRDYLPECMVLLKADGTFPISEPQRVALFGLGARHTIKGGTGSGDVNSRYFVTVEEGLENAGFTITTKDWLDQLDELLVKTKKEFISDIKRRARKKHTLAVFEGMGAVMRMPEYEFNLESDGDLAVYVLSRNSGEGNDRTFDKGDIRLSDTEKRDILYLNEKYAKFILVLNVGGPVDLSEISSVKNILLLSQLGVDTGTALADVLLGKSYPSGKLTTSWAYIKDYPSVGDFGEKDDTRYKEGIYVGYRYYDSVGIKNDYPFGYGLSYTSFEIKCDSAAVEGGKVKLNAAVTNTGMRPGKEVVQVYVSAPEGKLDKPYQVLATFGKTKELQAGQNDNLELEFNLKDIASFDEETDSYILEAGEYVVRIGNSSVNTFACVSLKLSDTVKVMQLKESLSGADFIDWKPEKRATNSHIAGEKVIEIKAEDILGAEGCHVVDYSEETLSSDFVKSLSDEELVYINLGRFDKKAGPLSVIGQAGARVAGAAGETSEVLENKGIQTLVMADGPAGLRLTPHFYRDKKGLAVGLGSALPADMSELLPVAAQLLMKMTAAKLPKNAKVEDQYCTAIPIGTALAQSFNLEFARNCGNIVGEEMEKFGIDLWLAPALNIHRDIRCGRNFEYYSEDPLVSGLMAAAITNGVQAHDKKGVTIKHYAANNQETCRYTNNSIISKRALREIYLKGFEICIKESKPRAVMTSYNLLNGVHTSERRDLCHDVLVKEFGHDGIIMTDWVVSMMADKTAKYEVAKAPRALAAGNNLFMPGCKGDFDDMMNALKSGEITREQLESGVFFEK